jgi:hypothetical protein
MYKKTNSLYFGIYIFLLQEEVIKATFEKQVGIIQDFEFVYGKNSRGVSFLTTTNQPHNQYACMYWLPVKSHMKHFSCSLANCADDLYSSTNLQYEISPVSWFNYYEKSSNLAMSISRSHALWDNVNKYKLRHI